MTFRQMWCAISRKGHKSAALMQVYRTPEQLAAGESILVALRCELCGYQTRWFAVQPIRPKDSP